MQPKIISMNPDFTALLELQDPDGVARRRWALYSTADDRLPSQESLKRERLGEDATLVVEASDLLLPGERSEKWPHPLAQPTLALNEVFKLS